MIVWLLFMLGQGLHILAQIDSVVRAKNTAVTSYLEVLKERWAAFVIRLFITSCFFWIFLGGEAGTILGAMKIQTPIWLESMNAVINSQAGPPLAGLIGFGIDSLLAYIPFLKSYIPSVDTQTTQFTQSTVDPGSGAVQTVKQTTEVSVSPVLPASKP